MRLDKLKLEGVLSWKLDISIKDNLRAKKFYEKNGFICSYEYLNDNIAGKELREVMYTYKLQEERLHG